MNPRIGSGIAVIVIALLIANLALGLGVIADCYAYGGCQ
jgi:hypothetical protein